MIGAGGAAAANAKECPQFVQYAAPSASAPPHLEQYKLVPRFFLTLRDDSPESHQILLSTIGRVNAPVSNAAAAGNS
jgi:hypothetical protein